MIINLYIKIIYLVKADPKASIVSFRQENPVAASTSVLAIPSIKLKSLISIKRFYTL